MISLSSRKAEASKFESPVPVGDMISFFFSSSCDNDDVGADVDERDDAGTSDPVTCEGKLVIICKKE